MTPSFDLAPPSLSTGDGYCVLPVRGLPELRPGDDLARLLADAADLQDGDVLVVTSKVVSKVEGRLVPVPPGAAREDVRLAAIESETVRVVARRGPNVIVQNRNGLVLAAAGVDASNVRPDEIALLPVDPDASAAALRRRLHELTGRRVAVVLSDTLGRPWRIGQVDRAIGVAGRAPVRAVVRVCRRSNMVPRTTSRSTSGPLLAAWERTSERCKSARFSGGMCVVASAPNPVETP